jgi:hypothetical protein
VTYCFRIRFRLGTSSRIQSATDELVFVSGGDGGERVVLRPRDGIPLREAAEIVLRGAGYGTREEAEEAASRWGDRLRLAFAQLRLGADFGLRAPRSAFTPYGLKMFEQTAGDRALNDVHGSMVFECEPPPRFVSWAGEVRVGKSAEQLVQLMKLEVGDLAMSEKLELAFDLYSGSFFQPSPDARFVMLMMALETLIDQEERGTSSLAHVDRLIDLTRQGNDLSREDRDSLIASLQGLRVESVGRAGRRLARSLGEREYMGESAITFFNRCYEMRSALVHGHYPRPDRADVGTRAAHLEGFVGDLLAAAMVASTTSPTDVA